MYAFCPREIGTELVQAPHKILERHDLTSSFSIASGPGSDLFVACLHTSLKGVSLSNLIFVRQSTVPKTLWY